MKFKFMFLLVILLLTISCIPDNGSSLTPQPSPTPTQEVGYACPGEPSGEFVVLNEDPCMGGRSRTVANDVEQWKPDGAYVVSEAVSVLGFPTELSGHAAITYENGYKFDMELINGEWGFGFPNQSVGSHCVVLKAVITENLSGVTDDDVIINAYLSWGDGNRAEFGGHQIDYNSVGNVEYIWAFRSDVTRFVTPEITVQAQWGAGHEGSNVVLKSVFVLKAPDGYCNGALVVE